MALPGTRSSRYALLTTLALLLAMLLAAYGGGVDTGYFGTILPGAKGARGGTLPSGGKVAVEMTLQGAGAAGVELYPMEVSLTSIGAD